MQSLKTKPSPHFHLLELNQFSIFEQLQIEEALIRSDDRNWILINRGTSPAIVMGISGKQEELINLEKIKHQPIPIIRRFSGGGTVVVDEHTHFYTLIGNRSVLNFPCYPRELMRWTEQLYMPAFPEKQFSLRDHDYVIFDKKFAGNAQYLTKERWLHHSSFLWDYNEQMMEYLLMPPKMPAYRQGRDHSTFLCRLKDNFPTQDNFTRCMLEAVEKEFNLIPVTLASIESILKKPHRQSTKFENV